MHGSFAKRKGKCWFFNACGHFSAAPKKFVVILLLCTERERKMKENSIANKILEKTLNSWKYGNYQIYLRMLTMYTYFRKLKKNTISWSRKHELYWNWTCVWDMAQKTLLTKHKSLREGSLSTVTQRTVSSLFGAVTWTFWQWT